MAVERIITKLLHKGLRVTSGIVERFSIHLCTITVVMQLFDGMVYSSEKTCCGRGFNDLGICLYLFFHLKKKKYKIV